MSDKEVLIESIQGNGGQLIAYISASGEREDLVEPLAASRGDHVRIYRGADGKLHGEIVPPPPKESRYRRKPLEFWSAFNDGHRQYFVANTPFGVASIDLYSDGYTLDFGGMSESQLGTLEEAKARVEAEITRRLASVLEVCDD